MALMMQYQQNLASIDSPSLQSYQQESLSDDEDFIMSNVSTKVYERSRIKALADERENVQKKTFTKWINSQIQPLGFHISDLYMDLRDGKFLLTLLEILSNDIVPKPTRGRMRIHCLENVDKCLGFLYDQKVHLENVGAHDIVDGNARLTLGLVWTMILRFQLQDIHLDYYFDEEEDERQEQYNDKAMVVEDVISKDTVDNVHATRETNNKFKSRQKKTVSMRSTDNPEAQSAKDALLLWCQIKTAGYPGVNIRNFTTSWRTGLGFCALIHKHRPDLLDYTAALKQSNPDNLSCAFQTAENKLGIAPLLDPEDVDVSQPDSKSIITYLASYYHYFNSHKTHSLLNKRLNRLLAQALDDENMERLYMDLANSLLQWIEKKVEELDDKSALNGAGLEGVKELLAEFSVYRIQEKPPKYKEKAEIEVLLFTLKRRGQGQVGGMQREELVGLASRLDAAWDGRLNSAEHAREQALYKELRRHERLALDAQRFRKRATLRRGWISVNLDLLTHQAPGADYTSTLAALKKHEAFETDIYAYESNLTALERLARGLETEGYEDAASVMTEQHEVQTAWARLLETLNWHRERLDNLLQLHRMLREYSEVQSAMQALQARLETKDCGKHLLGVEELLRKHELLDSDMQALDQRLDKVVAESNRYLKYSEKDFKGNNKNNSLVIDTKKQVLAQFDDLLAMAEKRKEELLHSQQVFQYLGEIEGEQQWMREVLGLLKSPDPSSVMQQQQQDVASTDRTLKKHKQLEVEIESRRVRLEERLMEGRALTELSDVGADRITAKNEEVLQMWEQLVESAEQKKVRLVGDMELMQVLAECEEIQQWVEETNRVFDEAAAADRPQHQHDVERNIRKNQEAMTIIQNKQQSVQELRAQATQLLDLIDDDNDSYGRRQRVMQAVEALEQDYELLVKRAHDLQEKLLDRLSVQRLLNDADSVRTWISEKEKFLVNFVPTDDIEELEVMKLRFETFETELTKRAEKVYHVNTLSENLASAGASQSSENFKVIVDNQDALNAKWNKMADVVDMKREELLSKYHYEHFCVDCTQTREWIEEKIAVVRALERSDDIDSGDQGNSGTLEAILQVQRRLDHVERDMCAIEAKMQFVDNQGEMLIRSGLGGGVHQVEARLDEVHRAWAELQDSVKSVASKLEGRGGVHKIVIELETMRDWLEEAAADMARRDTPDSLEQADKLMVEFNMLRSDISNREELVNELVQTGMDYLTKEGVSGVEASQIGQKLDSLQKSWRTLSSLTDEKEQFLDQYCKGLDFFDAAREFEKMMNQHENFLNKDLHSSNLIGLHEARNEHSEFVGRIENDHALLQEVLDKGAALLVEGHFQSDKIKAKCKNIEERWNKNLEMAKNRKDDIQETVKLQELLQDIEDLDDNLLDKINVLSQISVHNSSKPKATSFAQLKSIEEETRPLQQNIDELHDRAQTVAQELPKYEKEIQTGLDNLDSSWKELNSLIEDKLNSFSEMDKEEVFEESSKSIMDFLSTLESQMIPDEESEDTRVGVRAAEEKRKKLQEKEGELERRRQMLEQLEQSKQELQHKNPERAEHFEEVQQRVRVGLQNMSAPLSSQRQRAEQLRTGEETLQALEEEDDWLDEKLNQLAAKDRDLQPGTTNTASSSLCTMTVQASRALQRWLGGFRKEIDYRHNSPRLQALYQKAETMVQEGHPKSKQIQKAMSELQEKWRLLLETAGEFTERLQKEILVQEYLMNVSEACAWISEKELHLAAIKLDKKVKDEAQVRRASRKHSVLDKEISEYGATIRQLRGQKEEFQENKDMLEQVQTDLERNFTSLLALSDEKKIELDVSMEYCKVFELYQSLEAWIAARTKIAREDKVGRDLDECNFLRAQFSEFSTDTNKTGAEKLEHAWHLMDSVIRAGTGELAGVVAAWKDRINEMWADLLELIDTRIQLLKTAWDRHKWICDCQFLLELIEEKREHLLSLNALGSDSKSVLILHRKLTNFEVDLTRLSKDISVASDSLETLLPLYSQTHRDELVQHRDHLQEEFRKLRQLLEEHSVNNVGLADFHKFSAMIRELQQWIESVIAKMALPNTPNKPRDVSGVELLLSSHRSLKSEMDSKDENFSVTLNLGRTLLRSKHPESATIKAQCKEVSMSREAMGTRWYAVLDQLSLMVEVYQWARDAALAESWLVAQENQLLSAESLLSEQQQQDTNLENTIAILKRLVLLQKNAQNQEEKFEQLKRLTTLEMRARHLNPDKSHDTKQHSREGYAGLDVGQSSLIPTTTPGSSSHRPGLKRSGSIDSNLDLIVTADESSTYSHQQHQAPPLAVTTKARPQPSGATKRLDAASHPDMSANSRSPRPQVSSKRTPSPSLSSSSRHTAPRPAPSHRQQPSTSRGLVTSGQSMTHLATSLAGAAATTPTTMNSGSGIRPQDISMQGALYRKHQWNNKGQKASNRSWKSLYVEILNCRLYFFKDERHYRERPGQFYRHEMPLSLADVVAAPASDYVKRPCVFRVRVRSQGTEYLFQAGSIIEMTRWIEALNAAAGSITTTSTTPATAQATNTSTSSSSKAKSQPDLRRAGSTGAMSSRNNNNNNTNNGLKRFFSSIRLKK